VEFPAQLGEPKLSRSDMKYLSGQRSGAGIQIENTVEASRASRRWAWHLINALVAIFFIAGYLSTRQAFRNQALQYLLLTILSLTFCNLLMSRLNRPIQVTFPVWILLLGFGVGYFLQFFLVVSDPFFVSTGQIPVVLDSPAHVLIKVYTTTVLGFVTFCLTSWLLLGRSRARESSPTGTVQMTASAAKSTSSVLLVCILLLELIFGYISWVFDIAVMGAENASLPYRLAGVVFYTRSVLLPALILLVIWIADQHRLKRKLKLGIALLLAHGVLDALLRSSRSALLYSLLGLLFLTILTGRFTRRRLQVIGAGVLLSLLLFPVFTAYRYARLASNLIEVIPALRAGLATLPDAGTSEELASNTLSSIVFRVTGVNSMLEIMENGRRPLGLLHASRATDFFNNEITYLPPDALSANAPSLVGWFYLLGGNEFVVIGMFCFLVGVHLVWNSLRTSNLRSRWVAKASFLVLLIPAAVDGALDLLTWSFMMLGLSIAIAEWLLCRASHSKYLRAGVSQAG
jgi:hypothetical protein